MQREGRDDVRREAGTRDDGREGAAGVGGRSGESGCRVCSDEPSELQTLFRGDSAIANLGLPYSPVYSHAQTTSPHSRPRPEHSIDDDELAFQPRYAVGEAVLTDIKENASATGAPGRGVEQCSWWR